MIGELLQHPLSSAFPAMSEADQESLRDDIEANGQRDRGVVFEGMVLDGWHRYQACRALGIAFKFDEFDGKDPVSFVLSRNLHRRHLTASQRAAAVVAATNWRPAGVQDSKVAAAATMTNSDLAKTAEVSPRTIRHAKKAHEAGLGEAVKSGQVSAERAAEVADLPPKQREKALAEQPKPKKSEPKSDPAEIQTLREQIEALTEERDNLADTARELEDRLTAFEATEPDEQQKLIQKLQKQIVKLEAEIKRLTLARNDAQAKNNELIREVKRLRRHA